MRDVRKSRITSRFNAFLRVLGGWFVFGLESVESDHGRKQLADFMSSFIKTSKPCEKARHPQIAPLRLLGGADQMARYTDGSMGPVTLATEATFEDLGEKLGFNIDSRNFKTPRAMRKH